MILVIWLTPGTQGPGSASRATQARPTRLLQRARGAPPVRAARQTALHQGARTGPGGERAIVALIEHDGFGRIFRVAALAGRDTVAPKIVRWHVARKSRPHTDKSRLYAEVGAGFAAHETVAHAAKTVAHAAKEYAHGDARTNWAEASTIWPAP